MSNETFSLTQNGSSFSLKFLERAGGANVYSNGCGKEISFPLYTYWEIVGTLIGTEQFSILIRKSADLVERINDDILFVKVAHFTGDRAFSSGRQKISRIFLECAYTVDGFGIATNSFVVSFPHPRGRASLELRLTTEE